MKTLTTTLSLLLITGVAFAEEATEQPKDMRGNSDKPFAYTGEDLTRLPTRLGFSYDSGVNDHTGANTDDYLLTGSLSLLGFQVLAEIPLHSRLNPGSGETKSSYGDTFVSGSFSVPFNPKMRLAFGLDALLDTSGLNGLGTEESIYSPFAAIGVEMDEQNMALGKLSYTDSADNLVERWELMIRGLHRFNDQLFSSVEITPGWDSLNDEFLLNARALAGARIDRHHIASIEFTLPIDSDSREQRGSSLRLNYNFLF